MRILLATIGSDGDIQPFYALAHRLLASGHEVRLATSDRYRARAEALGIPFVAVGPPSDEPKLKKIFERVLAEPKPLKQLVIVVESGIDEQIASVPALMELARGVDLVVYPPIFVAAAAAARAVGTKHVSVHLAPLHRARGYSPTGSNLGRLGNSVMWTMASGVIRRATDERLNRIVHAAGLPPWRDILLKSSHSELLDLVAVSPHILPRDPLFPPQTRITGYFFVDEPDAAPEPKLESFVLGEAPVVIGFGSMMGIDPRRTTSLIVDAVKGMDKRVIIQSGWAGLGKGDLPKNVHVAGFVPHGWLFRRAACVIHHGGAGTTAAALRAGVPQTVVWHLGDQPVWGNKVLDFGVGLKPIHFRELTANWLRGAIEAMLADKAMKVRAEELGAAIRNEDGVDVAVRALEELGGRAK